MASYYTYGQIPSAEETVYGPLSQGYAEGGSVATAPTYIPPGLEAAFLRMRGQSPEQVAAREEAAAQTKPQREVLSNLLQTGQFDEAFKYAKENNVQNLLIDPNELKTLRGPFSNDEMKSFFSAMPKDLMGEQDEKEVKFTPDQALDQSLRVASIPKEGIGAGPLGDLIGYPDVQRAFEPQELKKEEGPFEKLIKAALIAGTIYAGGSAIAGLAGAGGAGAAGGAAGGTTGGLSGAVKAVGSIPAKIGGAIAEAVGLPITSTVGKAALGNAVITGGTTAAKGGDLEDVLKAALISAGVTYVSAPVIDSLKDAAKAVGSKLGIATGAPATAAGAAVSDALSNVATDDLLREVTVTATRPALSSLVGTAVGALPTSTKVDLPEPQIRTEPSVTQPAEALEEVVVTGTRPGLENLTGLGTLPSTTSPGAKEPAEIKDEPLPADQPLQEEMIEQPLEEVVVTGNRPSLEDLLGLGAVDIPKTTPVDIVKPDYIEDVVLPKEEDLEEVVVTGTRPPLSDLLGLGAIDIPTTTPVDLAPPDYIEDLTFPEGPIEEVVVEGSNKGGLDLPPFAIPLTTPVEGITEPKINKPSPLQGLLDEYGTLENLLKLLGALGGAASGRGTATPTLPTGGGMGGALPKYTLNRQQLSPDIDYYTYGTRPEAKFFDYGLQLEKPVQPQLPPAKSPEDDKAMATGGLTGYAKGGSNTSRYFNGPGSGRDDKIPALLSDGEYVIDAETLALLGDGSTKEGARRMDQFRANIRKHKGRALSRGQISPDAKSPSKYMGGGLT